MSAWLRIANVFRSGRVDRDIDEELQSHIDEALAAGRDAAEVSKAVGSRLRAREAARDALIATWLESLIADVAFGWRQILKRKTAAAAAIISLAIGIGSCLAAFRLIDALFLRPLPIAHPERLYALAYDQYFDGKLGRYEQFDYPVVPLMRSAVASQASILAIGFTVGIDLTFSSDQETERAWRQYVSGAIFTDFGLKPALGRLFDASDDAVPEAHPYAVISYDYWTRRFARDPNIIGKHFRTGIHELEIVGVAPKGFTGTEPGTFTDIFVPNMMNVPMIYRTSNSYRIWAVLKPSASVPVVAERLRAVLHSYREQVVKTWPPVRRQQEKDSFVESLVSLDPASGGRSRIQQSYERSLMILAVLVALVLLIACANIANLMMAQAAARSREMALRVSIGAGRGRLVQLVLIESALIGVTAAALGLAFSYWASSFITGRISTPDLPVRFVLLDDWRVLLFFLALTLGVTLLFGLAPALRASSTRPSSTLKGDDNPRAHRRLRSGLIIAQAAFCAFVLFTAGLFITTFQRMENQPTGFSSAGVLTLESESSAPLPADLWYRVALRLKSVPGAESAAMAEYALMSFNAQTGYVWANGHVPDGTWANSTWFLAVSPGWFETMKLSLIEGRDFRWDDAFPHVAIVNETFARRYFGEQDPVGRSFEADTSADMAGAVKLPPGRTRFEIVGVARDARYEDMRMPIRATAYVPFRGTRSIFDAWGRRLNRATFLVRTQMPDPMPLAAILRNEILREAPQIRVSSVITQEELVKLQMVRERFLAALALFFAAVALVLAAVGIYGVLNYAVVERRRELGIRIALGATSPNIARQVAAAAVATIAVGSLLGVGLGLASEPYVSALLYQVKANDPAILATPFVTLLCAALLAAVPPVIRALRIDPAALLRCD